MKYAVIISGGKQYRVTAGQIVQLEKLAGEPGDAVSFDQVLLLSDGEKTQVGQPYLDKVTVKGEVVSQDRAKKIFILKFKRRKHHMKRQGHRQYQTAVKILDIAAAE